MEISEIQYNIPIPKRGRKSKYENVYKKCSILKPGDSFTVKSFCILAKSLAEGLRIQINRRYGKGKFVLMPINEKTIRIWRK